MGPLQVIIRIGVAVFALKALLSLPGLSGIGQVVQAKTRNRHCRPPVSRDQVSDRVFPVAANSAATGGPYMKPAVHNENATLYAAIANCNNNLLVPQALIMLSSMVGQFTVIVE